MKSISAAFQTHLSSTATTYCLLMRVACKGAYEGVVKGFSGTDHDLLYDDGQGEVLYRADEGFSQSKLHKTADFGVDNAEATGVVSDASVSASDIIAGMFNFAEVTVYRVNYMDLSQGHEIVDYGTLGQTFFDDEIWRCEFRSLMQQAKQVQSTPYSLTCRASFGDDRCKMPLVWVSSTVTDFSNDPHRLFQASALSNPDNYWSPGVVEWLTGKNAKIQMEVEESWADGGVRLALPMPFAIEIGDTFRIRRDCKKTEQACKEYGNIINMRAEHLTPVADTALSIPGAYIKSQGAE